MVMAINIFEGARRIAKIVAGVWAVSLFTLIFFVYFVGTPSKEAPYLLLMAFAVLPLFC
jgi:hypothetical protein